MRLRSRRGLHASCTVVRPASRFCPAPNREAGDDFLQYFMVCPDDVVPTLIEVMDHATQRRYDYVRPETEAFRERVKEIFDDHRITYDLIDGEMIPFESREMHQEVVAPVLRLLAGHPDLEAVEDAYHDALGEIMKNPGDAITDAGRALQVTLELLGCEGNKLGPLIASARAKGLLASHDSGLTEGIRKIMDWVSADRSNLGDAHTASDPTPEDAWFTVHVVGALILRLAGGTRA